LRVLLRCSSSAESMRLGRFLSILLTEMHRRKANKADYEAEEKEKEATHPGKYQQTSYLGYRKVTLVWEKDLTEVCSRQKGLFNFSFFFFFFFFFFFLLGWGFVFFWAR
jgi:hypothetical protein